MLWFIYWCSEWNKLIQGSNFDKKIHKKSGILLWYILIILSMANAQGWAQSEDACHVSKTCQVPIWHFTGRGFLVPRWVSPTSTKPTTIIDGQLTHCHQHSHLQWPQRSHSTCGWGCVHQHVISLCHETIQHPLHHYLQSPPWFQSPILHSWIPAAAQQHTEDGCHWVVQMAWWCGRPDDMCKTVHLDLQFDEAVLSPITLYQSMLTKSQLVILPWHSNPRLQRNLSIWPKCHKGTRSIQPWVPLKSSLVPLLFPILVVLFPRTYPCCVPWIMYVQPPMFHTYICLLFSWIFFTWPIPIKL